MSGVIPLACGDCVRSCGRSEIKVPLMGSGAGIFLPISPLLDRTGRSRDNPRHLRIPERTPVMKRLLILASLVGAAPALADEGMWTYNNFPAAKVKEKYGFEPTQEWLDNVRSGLGAHRGRLLGSSFVSPDGLVMTNHHCARGCIEQLSTAKKDFIANGFYAKTQAEELQCPAMERQPARRAHRRHRAAATPPPRASPASRTPTRSRPRWPSIEKDCATGTDISLRGGDPVPGRQVQPLQVPALPGRPPRVRPRARHRLLRR